METNNDEVLYQNGDIILIFNNELYLVKDDKRYRLTSHPYEPCLYINQDDKMIKIIHNSFTTDEIIDCAGEKIKIHAISGTEYDIEKLCQILTCALNANIYETDISYLEKLLSQELTDDEFYQDFKKYDECVLDYCIVKINSKYNYEDSHKEAVLFAMNKWKNYLKEEYDMDISINPEKMRASKVKAKDFFAEPSKEYDKNIKPYWYLFMKPPHGSHYTIDDFNHVNNLLFPNGFNNLEIYNWSTDWSNYFDDGLEWWGAMCVSIYDKSLDRFVVIGASATD